MTTRKSVLIICCAVVALTLLTLQTGESSVVVQFPSALVYCSADNGSVVYFSPITDTALKVGSISTDVIAREFGEYLTGRYDDSGPGFRGGCPVFNRTIDAEASKRTLQVNARQAGVRFSSRDALRDWSN